MSRQFLSDTTATTQVNTEPRGADDVTKLATNPESVIDDALAGALPDWDLLPAAPFVRRVK